MRIEWDGCGEDRDLCKERDSEYERFDDQHLERVICTGSGLKTSLTILFLFDAILYLRLERSRSYRSYCFVTHLTTQLHQKCNLFYDQTDLLVAWIYQLWACPSHSRTRPPGERDIHARLW